MAKITLSEFAPQTGEEYGFTTSSESRTKFTVGPQGLQTSDKDIIEYATFSVLLDVGADAPTPVAPAPRPAAAPDTTKDKD